MALLAKVQLVVFRIIHLFRKYQIKLALPLDLKVEGFQLALLSLLTLKNLSRICQILLR